MSTSCDTLEEEERVNQSATKKKKMCQPTLDNSVTKTSKYTKDKIDQAIAQYFFASNTAFRQIESKSFINMVQTLRPGYKPPNRQQLASSLLDRVYNNIEKLLQNDIMDENNEMAITLLQDGWSSVRNDPIIASSIHSGTDVYLLSTKDCGSEKKTAEFCAKLAIEDIMKLKEQFNKETFAICTDNENKMISMREIVKQHYPKILTYGCSAHYLNLLEKEVTPQTVLKHIVEIQKYFRNHHRPHSWLREIGGKEPQLPNDTRWNSQIDCIETFLFNYHKYREIIKENKDEIDPSIVSKIDNMNIYKNCLDLKEQLKVVGEALDKLQSNKTTLSQAFKIWQDLMNDRKLEFYHDSIEKRFKQAMEPFHYLAFITDPAYLSVSVDGTALLEEVAISWMQSWEPEFVPYILSFRIKDYDTYQRSMFLPSVLESFSAYKWWKLVKNKTDSMSKMNNFCSFMMKLHSIPSSSAGLERIFSSFGHIWTKLRNKLGINKVEKLVKIYKYYN